LIEASWCDGRRSRHETIVVSVIIDGFHDTAFDALDGFQQGIALQFSVSSISGKGNNNNKQ
jgi:hypothetical protein